MSGGDDGDYAAFAARLAEDGIVRDAWIDGRPRLRAAPIWLSADQYARVRHAAEATTEACHALTQLCAREPRLLGEGLGLTPTQLRMWAASAPAWHGIARADVFLTQEGEAVAELNCDTPTGEAEAVALGAAAADGNGATDPNRALEGRFLGMLRFFAVRARSPDAPPPRTVGLVYPTELTDDLPLVRLYRRWLERHGHRVILGSPYNLTFEGGRTRLFDSPLDILIRHYKTDWWGERQSAWLDDPIEDSEPLEAPLRAVFSGMASGTLAVVNPWGAVVPQNKRSFALLWENKDCFPSEIEQTILRYIPLTRRLESLHTEQLLAERHDWVIKSDYGAEGEEVVVGRQVNEGTWREALSRARPGRWVAQRYFAAETDAAGAAVNLGVFVIGGRASGLYARVSVGATDGRAESAPALVRAG